MKKYYEMPECLIGMLSDCDVLTLSEGVEEAKDFYVMNIESLF